MRLTRNLVAYRLLAMHPVLHFTMIITCLIIWMTYPKEFFEFQLQKEKPIKNQLICTTAFGGEVTIMFIITACGHLVSSLLQYWYMKLMRQEGKLMGA